MRTNRERHGRPTLTKDVEREIVTQYLSSERVTVIADRLGVSTGSIYATLRRQGVPLRTESEGSTE